MKTNPKRGMHRLAGFGALAMAVTVLLSACSSVDRSRDVGDARVPGPVLAQQVCASCHGAEGRSSSPAFPVLAGQNKEYIETQLKAFRSHERKTGAGEAYMWGLAAHLTDEQISGLAAYYASKSPVTGRSEDPELLARGRDVFEKGLPGANVPACATCHGANAEGNQIFPRLAGQHADYVFKQLNVIRSSDARPAAAPMKTFAAALNDQDMRSVAAYVQSLGTR